MATKTKPPAPRAGRKNLPAEDAEQQEGPAADQDAGAEKHPGEEPQQAEQKGRSSKAGKRRGQMSLTTARMMVTLLRMKNSSHKHPVPERQRSDVCLKKEDPKRETGSRRSNDKGLP